MTQSTQPNINFSPRAVQCVEGYVSKYSSPTSSTTVDDICSIIKEQVVNFERDYDTRWFRSQQVHEFDGFTCADAKTGKPVVRQAFKLLREGQELLVMAPEEADLPDEYYVQRVIEESNFPEYQEYATIKFSLDNLRRQQDEDHQS